MDFGWFIGLFTVIVLIIKAKAIPLWPTATRGNAAILHIIVWQ